MAARKKSPESTAGADCACHQRLVRRLRRRYTRVVKRGDAWACFLQVDHQGFCVVDDTENKRANWYAIQLAKALARMITTNDLAHGTAGGEKPTQTH